ncbi:unnamed protein product [Echinostoma caproni]|uniref:Reverse transcriptase n=1 Tax=Echinostoma caproni TaxID=27848 RepID=A0A183B591_9TREM|nr:unnamed protein product [Echinostoma caproni]
MKEIIFLPEDMVKTLGSLDRGKATHPDEIHPKLLWPLESILKAPLARLFNQSMVAATLPQNWKVAAVTSIQKGGHRELPTNYRPVS